MFHVQFLPCGLVVLLFCFPYDDWSCWLFALKISNCSPLKLIFSEGPSFFVRSVCNQVALKLRLHVVALPASLAMSWPAEIKWKLNRSGLDLLVPVLQSSHSYILKASFNFASVNFFLATCFMFSFFPGVLWFFCFVFHTKTGAFGFLLWNFQTVLRSSSFFSEGPSFFVRSVCNDGALKLRLHVIALPASLAMSWPAEIKWKLNRSGIDFLVLVLQSSHSYILKASFNFASDKFFLATCFMFSFFPGVLWFFYSVFHTMTGVFGFLVWKFQIVLR